MAVGSSTLATMRTAPPQFTQVVTSMLNTRLRRCAHVDMDVGGRATHGAVAELMERPEGDSCARKRAFGAQIRLERI